MTGNKKIKRAARQLFRLCLVGELLDTNRARDVALRLASSTRRGSVQTLAQFLRLVRLDRERHTARIESAAPLADGVRKQIDADLARIYGAGLETIFGENPALIGGMRIKVGSDVYDDSVRAKLAALESRL